MAELSNELRAALEAEEAGDLVQLVRRKRPEDFVALRSLLADPTAPPGFRTKAMYALGRWGDPSVVRDITRLLPELDDRERIGALSALGRLGASEAAPAILGFASDPSPQVRKAAAVALSRMATPEAAAKLRDLAANDPVPWIRELAARRTP